MSSVPRSAAVRKLGVSAGRLIGDGLPGRGRETDVAIAVNLAAASGVRLIDVRGRGVETETLLGKALPRGNGEAAAFDLAVGALNAMVGARAVEQAARLSLQKLMVTSAAVVVVAAADLLGPEGEEVWRRLRRLQDEGLYHALGVRAEPGDDARGLARRFKPDLMQLPVSLLDQRLVADGALTELAEMGIEIQLRSVLAEGVLFLSRAALPAHLCDIGPRLSRIQRAIAEAGADPLQAALAFALNRPEAAAVVVGASTAAELRAVIAAAAAPTPSLDWSSLGLEHPQALRAA
jgi:aryl-alcohol dehydrogenase-like predicted oxidoreductase